jgi:hypothetical protein
MFPRPMVTPLASLSLVGPLALWISLSLIAFVQAVDDDFKDSLGCRFHAVAQFNSKIEALYFNQKYSHRLRKLFLENHFACMQGVIPSEAMQIEIGFRAIAELFSRNFEDCSGLRARAVGINDDQAPAPSRLKHYFHAICPGIKDTHTRVNMGCEVFVQALSHIDARTVITAIRVSASDYSKHLHAQPESGETAVRFIAVVTLAQPC